MGKKPPPETPEEKAARKQAAAARFGQGGQIESLVETAGCSCKGLRLRDAIKAAIVGEIPEFFEKDEERLARPVRAQLPAWDPKDKTRRMLDDYSEIVSELRREEINQDRANTLRVAGHVQKLIKGPGPPSVRRSTSSRGTRGARASPCPSTCPRRSGRTRRRSCGSGSS